MNSEIYNIAESQSVKNTLEELRKKIATIAGVTLIGNRLAVRFGAGETLKEVHMVILDVDDGTKCAWCGENHDVNYYCDERYESESK